MADAIDQATLDAAFARLDAKKGFELACGACGSRDPVADDPEKSIYTCDACGSVTAFGAEQPRVAISPHPDRRFVVLTFTHGREAGKKEIQLTLERQYAAGVVLETLSLAAPHLHRLVMAAVDAARDVPGAPKSAVVATLDEPFAGETPMHMAPEHARRSAPQRVPGPAPEVEGGRCQCGAKSDMANGSCFACAAAQLVG